jgi:phosphatidate phosphatase APP1
LTRDTHAQPKLVGVWGPAGAGKTHLVLSYLQRYRSDYDATFWIQAEQTASVDRNFMNIYRLLPKDSSSVAQTPEEVRSEVLTWFLVTSGKWLFVFDGADQLDKDNRNYVNLSLYIPSCRTAHVIVTSRSATVGTLSTFEGVHIKEENAPSAGATSGSHKAVVQVVHEKGTNLESKNQKGKSLAPPAPPAPPGLRRKQLAAMAGRMYKSGVTAVSEIKESSNQTRADQLDSVGDPKTSTSEDFPDVTIIGKGDEQMVLFPSYAKRHDPENPTGQQHLASVNMSEEEYWRNEWNRLDDERAIVDVDVRGWIYTPARDPLTRKNRLVMGLARNLSGILDPYNEQAQDLGVPKGSPYEVEEPKPKHIAEDFDLANANLTSRLAPFMTIPLVKTPVTIFFYNGVQSQSRTVETNDLGHFSLRAALEFAPTHMRVLSNKDLSATKAVQIIEPRGISLISNIEDTIKHSSSTTAKARFRNTFGRDLNDLAIEGVQEWYNTLSGLGVRIHYCSNGPWELYPVIAKYFQYTGLPSGSIRLQQYESMLQSIFEPDKDKRKDNMGRIIQDFPERKFILVGNSAELDLETYTDIALASPGRIVAILIRDVTTSDKVVDSGSEISRPTIPPPPPPRRRLTETSPARPVEVPSASNVDWPRRLQRANNILERAGIPLYTWRKGFDVAEELVQIVKRYGDYGP